MIVWLSWGIQETRVRFFLPFSFHIVSKKAASLASNSLLNTIKEISVTPCPSPSYGWYFWSRMSHEDPPKRATPLLYQFNKITDDWIPSLKWQLKAKANYGDKYICGNHRNCVLHDVRGGVVTQNYLFLWWRTLERDFSTKYKLKKIKEEEKPCERIFQSCCSGLIFKKKKLYTCTNMKKRGEKIRSLMGMVKQ